MGITADHSRVPRRAQEAGWMLPGNRPHMCFPPRSYPEGAGPGAIWRCYFPGRSNEESCGTMWMAEGIMVLHDVEDWPTGGKGREPLLGPERWFIHSDSVNHAYDVKGGEAKARWEEGQYDFEAAIDKINGAVQMILGIINGRS